MKKQSKSTTPRGAEPGIGKSNTIKGIQATPYIDLEDNMKKQPVQQTASEKKLFAEIKELRTTVEDVKAVVKAWVTTIDGQYRRVHKEVDALKQQTTPLSKPKPKDYVLTEADWRRVLMERYLCGFGWADEKFSHIGFLSSENWSWGIGAFTADNGTKYGTCKVLNMPGVLQPYFGQGCPVPAGTKVLMKQRCGLCSIGKALEQDWNNINCGSDIVAFMVLEQ